MKSLMNTKVGQKVENFLVSHPKTAKVLGYGLMTGAGLAALASTSQAQILDYNKMKMGQNDTNAYVVNKYPTKTSYIGIDKGSLTEQDSAGARKEQNDYLKVNAKVGLGVKTYHSKGSNNGSVTNLDDIATGATTAIWDGIKTGITAIVPDYVFGSASFASPNLNKSIANGDLGSKTNNVYNFGFGYEGASISNLNPDLLNAQVSYTMVQDYRKGTPVAYPGVIDASTTLPVQYYTFAASGGIEERNIGGVVKQTGFGYSISAVRYLNDVFADGYNFKVGVFNAQTGTANENNGLFEQRMNASGFILGASKAFGSQQFSVDYKTNLSKYNDFKAVYTDLNVGVSIIGYVKNVTDPSNSTTVMGGFGIQYFMY